MSLKNILLSFIGILLIALLPHFAGVPMFIFIPVLLVIIWLFLKINKENFNDLGFSLKRFQLKAVWVGAIAAILLFAFVQYLFFPLINKIFPLPPADLKDFAQVRHNPVNYIFFVLLSFVAGGIYEEIAFRGYIFSRIKKMVGGKYALPAAFFLTTVIFALYHWQLGPAGIINALICGAAYHILFLRYNRNLWYAVFFHGFFDTIAFTYIFLGLW